MGAKTGSRGPAGPTGSTGAAGAAGSTGATGAAGAAGADGTTRQCVGSYDAQSVAAGDNATPASSTPVACSYQGGPAGIGHVAPRAGDITAVSFQLDADPAGSSIVVAATINGTVQAGTATTLAAGSTRKASQTFMGSVPFVVNDVLGVSIRTGSGWSATSANLLADLEVTL